MWRLSGGRTVNSATLRGFPACGEPVEIPFLCFVCLWLLLFISQVPTNKEMKRKFFKGL